jgi:hypothetical protein
MLLGLQLRRLREQNRVDRRQAAQVIRCSESKISRLELGKLPFKAHEVNGLLDLYGVASGPERDRLLGMARYANVPGWWQSYSDVFPSWFETYVGLESAAGHIRTFESQLIPGLLQTDGYMRAVTSEGRLPRSARQVERRVALRRERQKILTQSNTVFWAIIDEAALRRPIGGRDVMHEQLDHLLRLMQRRSTVRIQVLPFATGGPSGEVGSFSYLRFAERELPQVIYLEVVYIEHLTGALYIDKTEDVEQYRGAFDRLSTTARLVDESADIIAKIMADL